MHDRDAVIRHVSEAIRFNANLSPQLRGLIQATAPAEVSFAEARLHDALVALASGYESTASNGGTYEQRIAAAKLALEAWSGPVEQYGEIRLGGGTVVRAPVALLRVAGFENRAHGWECLTSQRPMERLGRALSEGHRDTGAILRAIALKDEADRAHEAQTSARIASENERAAAGMRLAAARLDAKSRGVKED